MTRKIMLILLLILIKVFGKSTNNHNNNMKTHNKRTIMSDKTLEEVKLTFQNAVLGL